MGLSRSVVTTGWDGVRRGAVEHHVKGPLRSRLQYWPHPIPQIGLILVVCCNRVRPCQWNKCREKPRSIFIIRHIISWVLVNCPNKSDILKIHFINWENEFQSRRCIKFNLVIMYILIFKVKFGSHSIQMGRSITASLHPICSKYTFLWQRSWYTVVHARTIHLSMTMRDGIGWWKCTCREHHWGMRW